jgi:hypothetical protein
MFMIVSKDDYPVYELGIENLIKRKDQIYLHEFILHSSLDVIEQVQWNTNNMYLKTVDRFNELSVTCLLTPSSKHIDVPSKFSKFQMLNFFYCTRVAVRMLSRTFSMRSTSSL